MKALINNFIRIYLAKIGGNIPGNWSIRKLDFRRIRFIDIIFHTSYTDIYSVRLKLCIRKTYIAAWYYPSTDF